MKKMQFLVFYKNMHENLLKFGFMHINKNILIFYVFSMRNCFIFLSFREKLGIFYIESVSYCVILHLDI
jgi:hypothetical protein